LSEIRYRLDSYKKFLFVRDPMERLVSAYRNKLEHKVRSQHQAVAIDILKKFRKHYEIPANTSEISVTFSEFIRYILDKKLKRRQNLDEHWASYYDLCHPCIIGYDFVGKYETLVDDAQHILRSIGAPEEIQFPPLVPSKTKPLVRRYFDKLFRSEQSNLLWTYKMDYLLFDYAIPKLRNSSFPSN